MQLQFIRSLYYSRPYPHPLFLGKNNRDSRNATCTEEEQKHLHNEDAIFLIYIPEYLVNKAFS